MFTSLCLPTWTLCLHVCKRITFVCMNCVFMHWQCILQKWNMYSEMQDMGKSLHLLTPLPFSSPLSLPSLFVLLSLPSLLSFSHPLCMYVTLCRVDLGDGSTVAIGSPHSPTHGNQASVFLLLSSSPLPSTLRSSYSQLFPLGRLNSELSQSLWHSSRKPAWPDSKNENQLLPHCCQHPQSHRGR